MILLPVHRVDACGRAAACARVQEIAQVFLTEIHASKAAAFGVNLVMVQLVALTLTVIMMAAHKAAAHGGLVSARVQWTAQLSPANQTVFIKRDLDVSGIRLKILVLVHQTARV